MRTETRQIYTVTELKAKFPEAFEKALESYREEAAQNNCAWSDDICESGRKTVEAAGLTLREWSVDQSYPSESFYRIQGFGNDDDDNATGDYTGRKAREWITAAFLNGPHKYKFNWRIKRSPGDCPFTGVCFDDDFIDDIRDSIKGGSTLREAFEGLAVKAARLCEAESESEQTEEYFLDHADANGWEYTEDGERVK